MPSMNAMDTTSALRWDVFCHVIDNFGDVGVCWRLARDLAARGDTVRLIIDDARALAWMAPHGAGGVEVLAWPGPDLPGDVVVEAFGCTLPPRFVQAMAASPRAAAWINLEYLSAEAYVERCHGLPSPQSNGLVKWFFYPGFTPRSGGLLREPALKQALAAFDGHAWLACRGLAPRAGERVVSLFCYDDAPVLQLLNSLAEAPTLLLLAAGAAQHPGLQDAARVRVLNLPWLEQTEFDRLLWACDINFVRGEDSLVRALWAGRPFVWQAYVQGGGAQHAKLEAMLGQWAPPEAVARLWRAWNTAPGLGWPGFPPASDIAAWRRAVLDWRALQCRLPALGQQLRAFACSKRRDDHPGKPDPGC